jgi:hypothetical protein
VGKFPLIHDSTISDVNIKDPRDMLGNARARELAATPESEPSLDELSRSIAPPQGA